MSGYCSVRLNDPITGGSGHAQEAHPRDQRLGSAGDPSPRRAATKFCKEGNVVWYNPDSKIYFPPGSQFFGKTKSGGYTCKAFADKEGYRATKGN